MTIKFISFFLFASNTSLTIHQKEIVVYLILRSIEMSDYQTLTPWTEITNQSFSTYRIMLALGIFLPLLKLTQTDSGFEA